MLADYHMHCRPYSPDARDTMLDMARAAFERGITHICVTNHAENCTQDPQYPDQFPPFENWAALEADLKSVREQMAGKLDVRLGAEVGAPHYLPEEGRRIYSLPCLDFIIGSVHNLRNARDFCFLSYPEDFENFRPAVELYIDEYIEMSRSGMCDVLGHIGYMQKYMARQGKGFDMMQFEDRLRVLFRSCVEHGVGIEVNTAALHEALGEFLPQTSVIRLYREMGGEIITVGSDSHRAADVGQGVSEGHELLRSLGFGYVCLFKNHEPEFVRL